MLRDQARAKSAPHASGLVGGKLAGELHHDSTHTAARLTPVVAQRRAIAALLNTTSLTDAAHEAGLTLATLKDWLGQEDFRQAYLQARRESVSQMIAQLEHAGTPPAARAGNAHATPAPAAHTHATDPHAASVVPKASHAAPPATLPTPLPEDELTYHGAADRMLRSADPQLVMDVLLRFARSYWCRALVMVKRGEALHVLKGAGVGIEHDSLADVHVPLDAASSFSKVWDRGGVVFGRLNPCQIHDAFLHGLGGRTRPEACLLLPITVHGRIACMLYCDSGDERAAQQDLGELYRLADDAGTALEQTVHRRKTAEVPALKPAS